MVTYFENCLLPQFVSQGSFGAKQPMVSLGSSERQIMEGDNFQNYGGKDQCIYM